MKFSARTILAPILLMLGGCLGIPEGVTPVGDIDLQRYAGKWYEVARLDNRFERGLTRTSAEYSLRGDGGVRVVNRGWDASAGKWKSAEGRAFFATEDRTLGYLKVSFFGPFYGSYVIIALDRDAYRYAMVCGRDRKYLWILARAPELDDATVQRLVNKAAELGFDTGSLIFPQEGSAMDENGG